MRYIFYANQGKLIHKPRHLWSAEVVQKSDNHKGITIVKRVPFCRKNNILLSAVISYGLKREGNLLKKIMRGAPGISPKVIFCEKDSIIMEEIKGESLYTCRDRVRGKAEVYNRLKKQS